MPPAVSIIVPVYNAERTVGRCIESILNQEYTDFELLLVNDGSTDASGFLCDSYAAKDARIRVIHKKNGGVSAARNTALDLAQGTYLQFLDSDDWLTPDATSSLVRAAEDTGCDLIVADFYRVIGERVSQKGDIDEDGVMTREEYAAHMMENPADFYYGVMWNKLYRADIVHAHDDIICAEDMDWSEDLYFNLSYIRYAEKFYALSTPIYNYYNTPGSAVHTVLNPVNIVSTRATLFAYYKELYENLGLYEEYKPQIYKYLVAVAES